MSLDVAVSSELSLVFPTPVLQRRLFTDALNEKLARTVLAHRRHGKGRRVSGGGWQSDPDLLSWPELEVKLLASEILAAVQGINTRTDRNVDDGDDTRQPSRHGSPDPRCSFDEDRHALRASAWANVNGDGHYNTARSQPGYQWCAIYHVAAGRLAPDRLMNGVLEILDPRPAAPFGHLEKFGFGQPLEIEPKPGLAVIFPAWLQHAVHPFFGMGQRVTITMNITIEEKRPRSE